MPESEDELAEMQYTFAADQAAAQMMADPVKRNAPCCLCGGEPRVIGIYRPGPAHRKRLGGKPGKLRLFGYTLCEECALDPANLERVEDAILRQRGVH